MNAKHTHLLDASQVELIREALLRFETLGSQESARQELLVLTECSEIALRLDCEENELLAALELIETGCTPGGVVMADAVANVCRAAIAKAKGE